MESSEQSGNSTPPSAMPSTGAQELKPCPFCGGGALMSFGHDDCIVHSYCENEGEGCKRPAVCVAYCENKACRAHRGSSDMCGDMEALLRMDGWSDLCKAAIVAWNQRTSHSDTRGGESG